MGRGMTFSPIEDEYLRNNFDKTSAELEEGIFKMGYRRSRKSINRRLEKMREAGEVGLRSKDTVQRSYRQRTRRSKRLVPTEIEKPNDGWDTGSDSFDSGSEGFDTGVDEDDWDDDSE